MMMYLEMEGAHATTVQSQQPFLAVAPGHRYSGSFTDLPVAVRFGSLTPSTMPSSPRSYHTGLGGDVVTLVTSDLRRGAVVGVVSVVGGCATSPLPVFVVAFVGAAVVALLPLSGCTACCNLSSVASICVHAPDGSISGISRPSACCGARTSVARSLRGRRTGTETSLHRRVLIPVFSNGVTLE